MGFPFDTPTWEGVSGPIFMGTGGSMPGIFTLIAIVICVVLLVGGQMAESKKYRDYE